MKEFKSAHSRMFSRRRNLEDLADESTADKLPTSLDQSDPSSTCPSSTDSNNNNNSSNNANQEDNTGADAAIKTLVTKRKLGHLLPPVARVAVAN